MIKKEKAALIINDIPRLKPSQRQALLKTHGSPEKLKEINKTYLKSAFNWRSGPLDMPALTEEASRRWEYCRKNRIELLICGHPGYPELLSGIYDPPFMLFTRGRSLESDFSGTAVVGTRKPTGGALGQAFQVGLDLALRECPVVSGLALGVDGAAHRGALAGWGWTLGVLACGVDLVFPRSHSRLAYEMLETGGTLVSEYIPGTEPRRFHYPQRNRIISGLSMISIVIQAPRKSGALITADFALQEGRDVLVASSGLNCQGTRELAEQGATVIERGRELLNLLGVDTELKPGQALENPRGRTELLSRMEGELDGTVIGYRGSYYHVV